MTMERIPSQIIRLARRSKERAVRANRFDFMMCSVAIFERDGRRLATVRTPEPDRDQALLAVKLGAFGFSVDAVTTIMDVNFHKHDTDSSLLNPVTGEPWGPGDMQRILDEMGPDNPYVGEAVGVQRTTMDDAIAVNLPYKLDQRHRSVKWKEPHYDLTIGGGLVYEAITDYLATEGVLSQMEELYDMDHALLPGDARERTDRVTVDLLRRLGYVVKMDPS